MSYLWVANAKRFGRSPIGHQKISVTALLAITRILLRYFGVTASSGLKKPLTFKASGLIAGLRPALQLRRAACKRTQIWE